MSGVERRIRVVGAGATGKVSVARFAALPDLPDPKLLEQTALEMVRDDKAVVERQRMGRAEPSRPWLLTGAHPSRKAERVTFSGRLEESQSGKYVLLLPDGSGSGALQMLPCHEWYSFRKVAAATLNAPRGQDALSEAEKKMGARFGKSDAFAAKHTAALGDEAGGDDDATRPRLQVGDDDSDDADGKRADAADAAVAPDAEEDVYDDAGDADAGWVNAGLDQGDESDGADSKGEGLDVSDGDEFSDDDGADGRVGEEGADANENAWLGVDDGNRAADADAAGQAAGDAYQQVEGTDDESDDDGDDDDEDDDDDDGMDDGADGGGASAGAGASRAGGPAKRERASADSPTHDASALALSKRARMSGGGASFLTEADLVQMLRSWGAPPPTVQEFVSTLYKEIGPVSEEQKPVIFRMIEKIAMQISHGDKVVLVLRG